MNRQTSFTIEELEKQASEIKRTFCLTRFTDEMICFVLISRLKYNAKWSDIVKRFYELFGINKSSKTLYDSIVIKYQDDPKYLKMCKLNKK